MRFSINLLIFLFYCFSLYGQEFDENRLVTSGTIELSIPADNATFTFEVKGVGSSLNKAVIEAKNRVKFISDALFKNGLKEKNLSTSYFYSGENFGDKAFLSSKRDYKARITVMVNIDSLELLESSIIIVSDALPERISNITFSLKNYEQQKIEALEKAVKKAKEKATILASNMGAQLGSILYIEEVQNVPPQIRGRGGNYPNPFNASLEVSPEMSSFGKQKNSGFFVQQIKIVSKVNIIVELVTKSNDS